MNLPHNLYIHVPFCASKCNYCAFYSCADRNPDWKNWTDGIINEIKYWSKKIGHIDIPTIFFGGGTPSLMPVSFFEMVMNSIHENFNVLTNTEVTLESNPGTLDHEKLFQFKNLGVNRLSVGIQSFDDNVLKFMGRTHNSNQAMELLDSAHKMGLRVSGDFIYGLPDQTVLDIEKLCKKINDTGLQHCSMYELSIEPGTPFSKMDLKQPDNETMAKMYETIGQILKLPRYEVSNYAEPDQECAHNLNIWNGEPYIGLGRAAAGRPLIDGVWYEQTGGPIIMSPLDNSVRAIEKVMMGLRTKNGVRLTPDVLEILNKNYIQSNSDLLSITSDNHLVTTSKGILILDNILVNLVK